MESQDQDAVESSEPASAPASGEENVESANIQEENPEVSAKEVTKSQDEDTVESSEPASAPAPGEENIESTSIPDKTPEVKDTVEGEGETKLDETLPSASEDEDLAAVGEEEKVSSPKVEVKESPRGEVFNETEETAADGDADLQQPHIDGEPQPSPEAETKESKVNAEEPTPGKTVEADVLAENEEGNEGSINSEDNQSQRGQSVEGKEDAVAEDDEASEKPPSKSTEDRPNSESETDSAKAEHKDQAQKMEGDNEEDEEEDEETKQAKKKKIPDDFYYEYEDLCSKPFVTPESEIPQSLLHLTHSFGYDCTKRGNLQLLDDSTLMFVAGNVVVILNLKTKEQKYLRSSSGGGIATVVVHPSKMYFAVAEKGIMPNIIVYEYPSLRPYRILREGTEEAYSSVAFNNSGFLLASVGSSPDYMLTIWNWSQEQTLLRSKAFSQDVYKVTFSPENEEQLTTSGTGHIKFWKIATTYTGLKLQGLLGKFGKTSLTDIQGYVELPDGKVVSGSEWGNMLLWDGGLIKVEICRKGGKTCHNGPIHQFMLEEGELISVGADGAVRVWDFEAIDIADSKDDSGLFEIEPMNELVVGKNVSLYSMVKTSNTDQFMCYAQDANGAIWKLDLSFSNMTQDPECLFSFHAGNIQGVDVSPSTHLMATTAHDRSVRIYDYVDKREVTLTRFKQGGTFLTWAPRVVNPKGGLITVGFDDGVVRLLEVYDPKGLTLVAGRNSSSDAEIRLKQAFKPHTAAVTAMAYEKNGELLATGSLDNTVFLFSVGDRYEAIGFVKVPGPVRELVWSPPTHEKSTLLILCENGHVVEILPPDPEKQDTVSTFELKNISMKHFAFRSIKSKIMRERAIIQREQAREKREKEKKERLRKMEQLGQEITEKDLQDDPEVEEEPLPDIYIPETPSRILCGFYSEPGQFWLCLGEYDCGFLYHCKFSEQQDNVDPSKRQDEPFTYIELDNACDDPIRNFHFSSNRQLLFCGMYSGAVRVYTVEAGDVTLKSLLCYWQLSLHDNHYGHIQRLRCSFDDQFVVTTGEDGNIFILSLLPQEDIDRALQKRKAKIPSPRSDLEKDRIVDDIEDPNAYSIENAKQKMEMDRMIKEAEEKKAIKRKLLAKLQKEFKQLLLKNKDLPEHVQFHRAEFELDPRIREETEKSTAQRIRLVRKELAWEQEKQRIGLQKLQEKFLNKVKWNTIVVTAFKSQHQVTTYRLMALSEKYHTMKNKVLHKGLDDLDRRKSKLGEVAKESGGSDATGERHQANEDLLLKPGSHISGVQLVGRQAEKLQKAIEKAEKAKAKIERRKKEWEALYARKPDENYEDPADVHALKEAYDSMGDFKLKTAKDFTVPEHLRMTPEKKRRQLVILEQQMYDAKSEINSKVLALRDNKIACIDQIRRHVEELKNMQANMEPSKRLPLPKLPSLLPQEVPERKMQYTEETLIAYKETLSKKKGHSTNAETSEHFSGFGGFAGGKAEQTEGVPTPDTAETEEGSQSSSLQTPSEPQESTLTDLEIEILQAEEIKNLYMQKHLLEKVEDIMMKFDAELRLLRHQKMQLDIGVKMADLRHLTLYEELLLLKDFERRENTLQEKVNSRIEESMLMTRKLEECSALMDVKKRDIAKLLEREKMVHTSFQSQLGENNKFVKFLTKVFKLKVKRVKKEVSEEDEDEESDDESLEESSWGSEEDDSESETGALDLSTCPPNCDPDIFENTIQLREKRMDIEEALTEEKKIADNLKKENDSIAKKLKVVNASLKAAEAELELFQREKQQKLNELIVVVPLRLHQIEFVNNVSLPNDLSQALIFTNQALTQLQQRIQELHVEKVNQWDLYKKARQQHVQLNRDRRDMETKIQMLQEKSKQLMQLKFGRVVDLQALQVVSVNRNVEEMKEKARVNEVIFAREMEAWEKKIWEMKMQQAEVTRANTQKLDELNSMLMQKAQLEEQLDARQKSLGKQFHGKPQAEIEERQRLIELVEMQAQEIEILQDEIDLLSRKGGHILPPAQPPNV
ncbi:cilia- and flagella-associated protein 44 isoform X2 [Erpetoichthys calabaricus]|uniref:cilia- and flagella-associated protein 44 isoform X2 n=1 Tax=Erpetoichthys calabaricus TaxID=27687 RepID=UPI0022348835|nr:cilia- and flagella-associated protein 44 isoform X2 [Erpetoichthys calabaricus]